jgi:hydroxyethylthiazole kinase-like uncharacterized protein yjeF
VNPTDLLADMRPWPMHGAASTRVAERQAQAELASHELMRRAGLSVARWLTALHPHARSIAVLAGAGNNGGDGLVAAWHLHRQGRRVTVWRVGSARTVPEDAAWALQQALEAGVDVRFGVPSDPALSPAAWPAGSPALWLDALAGIGATRPAAGPLGDSIRFLQRARVPVLSIDVPSGLDADTGTALGGLAVRAEATLSLLSIKPGLFMASGRDHAGRIWFDNLGVAAPAPDARLISTAEATPLRRRHAHHKGSFGDLVVVGGAPGMQGAAWLAARAALAAGAGRVHLSLLDPAPVPGARPWPSLMLRHAAWQEPDLLAASTVVCGCGGGQPLAALLPAVLAGSRRLLLDADALNAVAVSPELQDALRARSVRNQPTLVTPHPLEAARLLGISAAEVQCDRLKAARLLAERLRCVVVLKGSGTVIARVGTFPAINPTGNALLATAGSGDVLAGWMGGVWASQDDATPETAAASAAMSAVWLHGHAADLAAASGRVAPLLAEQQIGAMAQAAAHGAGSSAEALP